MQYAILAALGTGILLLIKGITAVIKRRGGKSGLLCVALGAVLALGAAWYCIPAAYPELSPEEQVSIHIVYSHGQTDLWVEDQQHKDQLISLLNELRFQREFFHGYRGMKFQDSEYVYMLVTWDEGVLGLHMTLNPDGFAYGRGNCFDHRYARVTNAAALIGKIRELLPPLTK